MEKSMCGVINFNSEERSMTETERMTVWFKVFSMSQAEHVNRSVEKNMKLKKPYI